MANSIMPPGYTSDLIATYVAPEQFTATGVKALEAALPTGSLMCLQVDLSSRPDDLEGIASELSQALKDAGIQSWLTEPAVADTVFPRVYVTWVNEGKGDVVANAWQAFLTTTPGLILGGLFVFMFMFLVIPGFSELMETIITFGMMMFMMYFMTQIMSGFVPALKPVAEKQKELVEKAKAGAPEAIKEIRSLAEKGVSWAERAWREIRGK